MSNKRQSFMEGALVLIVAGLLVKIIGAVFKIPLYNVLGSRAMGYFSTAYEVYVAAYVVTTAGLPVAISRLVSESNAEGRYSNSKRILYVAFSAFLLLGVVCCAAMFFGADWLAGMFKNPNAAPAIRVIAPAILFEIVMSAYRGYYQGCHNMVPTGISQIIVALAKLGGGIVAANYVFGLGLPEERALPLAAAGAVAGVTLGTLLGAIYLVLRMFFFRSYRPEGLPESATVEPTGALLKKVIVITVPIALGSMVTSVSNMVDTALIIPRLLVSGEGQTVAEGLYGIYTGMVRTMFNLPSALIIPIGVAVIPAIAERFARSKREAVEVMSSALRLASMMALPAGFGLMFMAQPILLLLYRAQAQDVAVAAPLLSTLGFAVAFVCLVSIANAVLQAVGREKVPMVTMLTGGLVKIATTYLLVGNPRYGIAGAPVSTILCYTTIMVLNFMVLRRTIGGFPKLWDLFARPLLCSVVACGAARLVYEAAIRALSSAPATVLGILAAVILYVILVLVTKTLYRSDVLLLPKGEIIAKLLEKRGWMR